MSTYLTGSCVPISDATRSENGRFKMLMEDLQKESDSLSEQ